jgi:hypothetical protein
LAWRRCWKKIRVVHGVCAERGVAAIFN